MHLNFPRCFCNRSASQAASSSFQTPIQSDDSGLSLSGLDQDLSGLELLAATALRDQNEVNEFTHVVNLDINRFTRFVINFSSFQSEPLSPRAPQPLVASTPASAPASLQESSVLNLPLNENEVNELRM